MRQVFISYARDDRDRVEALAERVRRLVDGVWFDSQLHGGEDWWAGILERIRSCDVFLSVVSQSSLDSEACRIEREYARQIDRTIIPVALEHVPQALPTDLATLQIVDFTTPGEGALTDLARALLGAHDAAPVPDPLPEDPEPPLSYLTSLVDLVASPRELTKSEQMDILSRLEHGLQASDPDEHEGARQVLSHMAVRDDLASSVEKTIRLLGGEHPREPSSLHQAEQPARPAATQAAPLHDQAPRSVTVEPEPEPEPARAADVTSASAAASGSSRDSELDDRRHRRLVTVAVLAVLAGILGVTWAALGRNSTVTTIDDPTVVETQGPDTTGDRGGVVGKTDPPPPPPSSSGSPCEPPPSNFPGQVTHGTSSEEALIWQRLLVSLRVFNSNDENCTGAYTGEKQKLVVENKRQYLGLDRSDGLLDEEFYQCLVGDNTCRECPPVPDVIGQSIDQAEFDIRDAGFGVKPDVTEISVEERFEAERRGIIFDTVLEQQPRPNARLECGSDVTITAYTVM